MDLRRVARRLGAGAWLLACVALLAACAAKTPPRGSVHEGSVALGTRLVPLPPGPWTVLSDAELPMQLSDGSALAYRTIVLVQEKDGRTTGIIRAGAFDAYPMGLVYRGTPAACQTNNWNLRPTVAEIGSNYYDCRRLFLMAPAGTTSGSVSPDWQVVLDRQRANPAFLPSLAPSVMFGLADRTGRFQVDVIFNPEARGLLRDTRNWAQNSWNTGNRTPQHNAYIARLADWAEAAHPAMRTGLSGRTPPPLPPF